MSELGLSEVELRKKKRSEYARDWYQRNRERVLERQRKYQSNNRAKLAERQRKYYHRNSKKKNSTLVRNRLKLPTPTRECPEFCEICGDLPQYRSMALDHCHKTNKFRGWLCGRCNGGLGLLGDNLESLRRAVKYLEAFEAQAVSEK